MSFAQGTACKGQQEGEHFSGRHRKTVIKKPNGMGTLFSLSMARPSENFFLY